MTKRFNVFPVLYVPQGTVTNAKKLQTWIFNLCCPMTDWVQITDGHILSINRKCDALRAEDLSHRQQSIFEFRHLQR